MRRTLEKHDDTNHGPATDEQSTPASAAVAGMDEDADDQTLPEDLVVEQWGQALQQCDNEITAVSVELSGFTFHPEGQTLAEALASFERHKERQSYLMSRREALHAVRPWLDEQLSKAKNVAKSAVRRTQVQPIVSDMLAETNLFKKAQLLRQLAQLGGVQ